ncbi:hypothetical protein DAPPUDRAFT_243330 [Daphnia pulex]|uniref:Uncharacterized protein n=1 Tax=Daphnia pulex TaxID=6669 RepID=E9GIH7_DAPPU|nr:hypothetical protein DAPPUDRAFT_243330 [Daphnia pulex]|eukprot:EFX80760.1 hypothetical protein DAPPUDRAFT_243330 [Daphnia pulex]
MMNLAWHSYECQVMFHDSGTGVILVRIFKKLFKQLYLSRRNGVHPSVQGNQIMMLKLSFYIRTATDMACSIFPKDLREEEKNFKLI